MTYLTIASDALIEEARRCHGLAVEQAVRDTERLLLAGYVPATERLMCWLLSRLRALPRRGQPYVTESAARIASGEA